MFRVLVSCLTVFNVLAVMVAAAAIAPARASTYTDPQLRVATPAHYARTPPLRDMPNLDLPAGMRRVIGGQHYSKAKRDNLRKRLKKSGYLQKFSLLPIPQRQTFARPAGSSATPQAALQRQFGASPLALTGAGAGFEGLGYSAGDAPDCSYPDTDVAAGADYLIESANLCDAGITEFAVYDKSGTMRLGPVNLANLWSSGVCADHPQGHGIVLYDQLAHRWILSQQAGSEFFATDECIAVSASADPTGRYYTYDFAILPNRSIGVPGLAVWPDAYYATFNVFSLLYGGQFEGTAFVAFQKKAMLSGDPEAKMIVILGSPHGLDGSVLPANLEGHAVPPAGASEIFLDYVSPFTWGVPYEALEMWRMQVNWTTPSNSTLTGPKPITVAPFTDGVCGAVLACIPQPSPATSRNYLFSRSDRLMPGLEYRNLGAGGQALVVNQTVATSDTGYPPAGVRWYELTAPVAATASDAWSLTQQSTYAPDDGNSRWMGSIALDALGNIALGYSVSGPLTTYPSIAYTGRLATDALNRMTQPETMLASGVGIAPDSLWGERSMMTVDPGDGCTFWYAQEYWGKRTKTSQTWKMWWSTHIGSFRFSNCTQSVTGTVSGTVTDSTGSAVENATVTLVPGDIVVKTTASGHFEVRVAAGHYTATVTDFGYRPRSGEVMVAANKPTTRDFQLSQEARATVTGTVTDTAHGYGLYAAIVVTAPNAGTVAEVWTDPVSGDYRVHLPVDNAYTLHARSWLPGYQADNVTVTLSGDTALNLPMAADASCTAPGYRSAFGEDFNRGVPPPGWSVVNYQKVYSAENTMIWTSRGHWYDGNYTGGRGEAATMDAAKQVLLRRSLADFDAGLITPPIAVSAVAADPILTYRTSYIHGPGDALDLDISADDGQTWTTISHWTSNHGAFYALPGEEERVNLASYLPASGQFRLRWRYYHDLQQGPGDYWWYAQIDDVSIGACSPQAGGLVTGRVYDANTGIGLIGATVSPDASAAPIETYYNSKDGDLPAGTYFMFLPAGSHTMTVSDPGYSEASKTFKVSAHQVTQENVALPAGKLAGKPSAGIHLHLMVNTPKQVTFSVTNTGSGTARYRLSPTPAATRATPGHNASAVGLTETACKHEIMPLSAVGGRSGLDDCTLLPSAASGSSPGEPSQWKSIASYPAIRNLLGNITMVQDPRNGRVYSMGGLVKAGKLAPNHVIDAAYVYDPTTDKWSPIASLPFKAQGGGAAFINGKIYLADSWSPDGAVAAKLAIYDPATNEWSLGAPNPQPRVHASVVALNGELYVIGGCALTDDLANDCPATTTVEVYDPAVNRWHAAAPYPEAVTLQACGALYGKIYCAGGRGTTGVHNNYPGMRDAFMYNPAVDRWRAIAPVPYADWGMGYAAVHGLLLISGGVTNASTIITNRTAAYNARTNRWTALPQSPFQFRQMGSACGFYVVKPGSGTAEVLPGYSCGYPPLSWLTATPPGGTVAAGETVNVTLQFNGQPDQAMTTSHAQLILSGDGTPYAAQHIPVSVTWSPQPVDLEVAVSGNPQTVYLSGDGNDENAYLDYTVTVKNRSLSGYGGATGVVLSARLPSSASYVAQTNGLCQLDSRTVHCALGDLAAGTGKTLDLVLKATQAGEVKTDFEATANEPQGKAGDNVATITSSVEPLPEKGSGGGSGSGSLGFMVLMSWLALILSGALFRVSSFAGRDGKATHRRDL